MFDSANYMKRATMNRSFCEMYVEEVYENEMYVDETTVSHVQKSRVACRQLELAVMIRLMIGLRLSDSL